MRIVATPLIVLALAALASMPCASRAVARTLDAWEWFGPVDMSVDHIPPVPGEEVGGRADEDGPYAPLYTPDLASDCCPASPGRVASDRAVAWEPSPDAGGWDQVRERLLADGFDREFVDTIYGLPGMAYDPDPMQDKLRSLFKSMFRASRVKEVQTLLARLGYDPGTADGVYGEMTAAAVVAFQADAGLEQDGITSRTLLRHVENAVRKAKGLAPLPLEEENPDPGPGIVYESVLKAARFSEGLEYYVANRPLLREVERRSGVPDELGVAIMTIETRVGNYLGTRPALVTLASMAAGRDMALVAEMFADRSLTEEQEAWIEDRALEKSEWAYQELKALLAYIALTGKDPMDMVGSVYGAVGVSQFMPSNILLYGVDGDRDGQVDLFDHHDAVPSMASYLLGHGYSPGAEGVELRRTMYGYNHSWRYVNTVLAVADRLSRFDAGMALPEPGRTVRVTDARELLQALAPGTLIVVDAATLDFSGVAQAPTPHVRWERQGDVAWPVFHGLDGVVIQGVGELTLRASGEGAPVLSFEDCGVLALDNVRIEGTPAGEGPPGLMVARTETLLLRDVALAGGNAGIGLLQVGKAFGLNILVERTEEGALIARGVELLHLDNVVLRENRGQALLVLEEVSSARIRQALVRNNEGVGGDSALVLARESGPMLLSGTYLVGNGFRYRSRPGAAVTLEDCTLKKNDF